MRCSLFTIERAMAPTTMSAICKPSSNASIRKHVISLAALLVIEHTATIAARPVSRPSGSIAEKPLGLDTVLAVDLV